MNIQQRVYAFIPIHPYGIALCELRKLLLLYPLSVNNAVTRLVQLGCIEPVPHNPGRYRRVDDRPCPPDLRGRHRGHRRRPIEKDAIA